VSGGLPELLEALAETLLQPGAFPRQKVEALRREAWIPSPLAAALDQLLAAPAEDLAVAYAGYFLVGRDRPTLHLEYSAHRYGRLQAPESMAALAPLYAEAGLMAPAGVAPDHFGLLLAMLAHHLRFLGREESVSAEAAIRALLGEFLKPFVQTLREAMGDSRGFYPAALEAAEATLSLTWNLLA